jgi:hypothetical protein
MSDVSGIPNMGFGGGNFFAPQFSYNPQMSAGQASAAYMPAENYAQNVTNNLYSSGGGFGRQTDYYSGLGANYAAQGMSPYGVFSDPGLSTPYRSMPDVWTNGAAPFQGGGGSSGMGGSIFDGGLSGGGYQPSYGGYGGDTFGGMGGGRSDPFPGMSMPGGLNSPMSGGGALDWSHLWDGGGGGGGPRADPYPGMAMPGGLNAPMTSPPNSYDTFQGGWGNVSGDKGADPYPGMAMPGGLGAPMTTAATPDFNTLWDQRTGGLGDTGSQGYGPGLGNAPAAMPSSQRLLGYEPQNQDQRLDWSTFQSPANDYGTFQGGWGNVSGDKPQGPEAGGALAPGGGLTATDLSAQARERLAELMKPGEKAAETALPAEPLGPGMRDFVSPANEYSTFQQASPVDPYAALADAIPLPKERPEGADAPRPPADIPEQADMSMAGRKATLLGTVGKELEAQGLHMTSSYRDPSDPLSKENPRSAHSRGLAFDVRAHTAEQGDAAMSKIRELLDTRGLKEGTDYRILDEVRNPSPWATGPHIHTQFTEAGMEKYQQQVYQDPYPNAPRPPADIPYPNGIPLPAARPEGAGPGAGEPSILPPQPLPEGASRPPAGIPGVSDGGFNAIDAAAANISGGGFNAIDAAAKHTGLELARANIDTPIEKIAMERGGQKAVDQVSSMAIGKTPRELMQTYGGLFMSRAEPLFQSLGITRQDFDKAIAMPPTKQDIKMRFGDFGTAPGGEPPAAGGFTPFEGFSPSGNVEDRRSEVLGRDELAGLQARGTNYDPWLLPETTAPNPMSTALGLEDLPRATKFASDELAGPTPFAGGSLEAPNPITGMPSSQDLLGYTPQQWPDEAYPASFNERFGGDAVAPGPTTTTTTTSMRDFPSPANNYGTFQGAASPENRLEAQRAAFAASIRDNPEKSLQLAARLYSEDQNNPATRQAILEAMLNAQQASGRDPLDLKYYPSNTQQYRAALAKLSSNNDLLNRIYQEMETPFSGSNRSNYATDWASGGVASNERKYTTPTWTSPTNEQFFRKDISNDWTGPSRAVQNQKWYQSTSGRAR